jgi:hypothetical protein
MKNLAEPIAFLTAFGPLYHRQPKGSASEIRSTPALILAQPNFSNCMLTLSECVGMGLTRNCKRHSSHQSSALTSHDTLDNRKNTGTHLWAFSLRSDVHIADK